MKEQSTTNNETVQEHQSTDDEVWSNIITDSLDAIVEAIHAFLETHMWKIELIGILVLICFIALGIFVTLISLIT